VARAIFFSLSVDFRAVRCGNHQGSGSRNASQSPTGLHEAGRNLYRDARSGNYYRCTRDALVTPILAQRPS
jgi:hypothetical protein